MNRISKTALIAIAVVGIAAPAFAQSFDPAGARQSGINAFAMVPAGGWGDLHPGATGGGSIGYNENLRRDQW